MKILILGANSEIATATAAQFAAKEKAELCLASRDIDHLEVVAADFNVRYRVNTEVLFFDALDFVSHESFYRSLKPKPDGIIVSFGYLGNQLSAQTDFNETQRILASNLIGAISILEIIADDFSRRQNGFMIIFSSVAGIRGRKSNYIYGAAKGGLSIYLEGLQHRLFHRNITVTNILPGFVRTKMTADIPFPHFLAASPERIAEIAFKAFKHKQSVVYAPWYWFPIMNVIRLLPRSLFYRTNL